MNLNSLQSSPLPKSHRHSSDCPHHKLRHSNTRWFNRDGQVRLDIRRLEELVCQDLAKLTGRPLGRQFIGLVDRHEATQREDSGSFMSPTPGTWTLFQSKHGNSFNTELDEVAHFLMEVARRPKVAKYFPPQILSEIYTFCGIIQEMHQEYSLAEKSHLKALWIARKLPDYCKEQVQASSQQLQEVSTKVARSNV